MVKVRYSISRTWFFTSYTTTLHVWNIIYAYIGVVLEVNVVTCIIYYIIYILHTWSVWDRSYSHPFNELAMLLLVTSFGRMKSFNRTRRKKRTVNMLDA